MHDYNAVDISHSLSMDLSFVFETYTQPHMHMPAEMHTQIRRYNYISVSMKPIAAICTARIATVILYTHLFLILLKKLFLFNHSIQIWNVFVCFVLHSD